MQWINEVAMVDSVDDLRSSSSIRGISMPNFEVLDARIASALNKIIQNTRFKRRISLEEHKAQKQDRFLRGRQIAYLIYDYFRVTGIHDSVENCADLFTISLRNDDIQEFDSKWDGILLSMTKIPPDDILEGLYKLRIRESEKLKTVLELYDLETHQKKLGPDYHRLKAMVKRSIEQEIRNKNFGARSGNFEKNAVVKNQGTKQRVQRILGDVGNGISTGSVPEETIAVSATISISVEKLHHQIRLRILSCSRMSESHREPEVPEEKVPLVECRDGLARITSKELAITHFVQSGTLQNACSTRPRVVVGLGKSALLRIARLKTSPAKGLKIGDKSAVAMLKKGDWQERGPVTDQCHDRSGKPDKRSDKKLGRKSLNVDHLMHDNSVAYFRIWSRRSLHRFCGRAQTYGSQSDVFDSLKPWYVMLAFETKIHRLE